MTEIHGEVAPGFEPVRDAFQANFDAGVEAGAATSIYKDGVKIVDLWGGVRNPQNEPWEEDTLQLVFSTTKGATAACAALLVQRGLLDVDAPVASYWPEFAAEGKTDIPVRWLLSHRAGLPGVDNPLTPEEVCAWTPVTDALAAQKPYWEPGTKHGYHALTYGHLVGEVIRRISGMTVGEYFASEIADPLDAEFHIGLPAEKEPRVSKFVQGPPPDFANMEVTDDVKELVAAIMDPTSVVSKSFNFIQPSLDMDSAAVHAAEIPAANGICTARGLARFYAGLFGEVDGVRILDDATIAMFTAEQTHGKDEILKKITRFGLGFMLDGPDVPYFGEGSFGHDGAGGSLGFADPGSGIAFGYVMNRMNQGINADPRPHAIITALKGCLS